ncbi:hypothetical protein WBN73_15420 [Paenarthrobacter sp. CCNWLY172]|uniref:Uncharacterized protein n=1 Tax=Paenarthrobacter sp. AMU7 TaxID=3162492 RepID=A0AB39YP64_9MICC|nr:MULTISPECIES: hypothetical protein [Micrococcaceae]WGM20908.1 hypothetical protein QEH68_01580 [Paenarthrobacter sp. OM7]
MKNIKAVHDRRDEWDRSHFELWTAELRAGEPRLISAAWVGWHEEEEDPA